MEILNELKRILVTEDISTLFQPIVLLKTGRVIGYEALSRGPKDSILYSPLDLLKAAEDNNCLWDLEILFRKKAIEKSSNITKDKLLFINIDPKIIYDDNYRIGFTKELIDSYNMPPNSIVFEITERNSILDFNYYKQILDNYTNQGYQIAIDDAGSGYSGMTTIKHIRPHYIKIDMDLIRDIHKDSLNQAIVKAFVDLSVTANIKLIAEGIETEEELDTLIRLGVYAGQGYFIQKPSEDIKDIANDVIETIYDCNRYSDSIFSLSPSYHHIGSIMEEIESFTTSTPCKIIKEKFESTHIDGICLTENNIPMGLTMKYQLNSILARPYGVAVYSNRPICLIMDEFPLVVDYYTPIKRVSELAMSRGEEKVYDNIIVTKNSKYLGIVSVKKLLEYTTSMEKNYAKELNPLTHLPGNLIINRVLSDIVQCNNNCCILYLDLDNFKIYNDAYGFENGDKVIKFTANIINKIVKNSSSNNSFVGHIGGDDFICVIDSSIENCNQICKQIIESFDNGVLPYFSDKDSKRGYVTSHDRHGFKKNFGLTSISIAGLYGDLSKFKTSDDLAQYMSIIKRQVKKVEGSYYRIEIIDDNNYSISNAI